MRPGVLDINTSAYTQSPTDATGLYSFMDLAVLVLQGRFISFPYRQAAQTGKGKFSNRFGSIQLLAMA